jgi:hypothetical protein
MGEGGGGGGGGGGVKACAAQAPVSAARPSTARAACTFARVARCAALARRTSSQSWPQVPGRPPGKAATLPIRAAVLWVRGCKHLCQRVQACVLEGGRGRLAELVARFGDVVRERA